MSLKITASQILVQNANGTEKFNSGNKLVYKKSTQTGSATIGGSSGQKTSIPLSVAFDRSRDVPIIYVTITAGAGNVASQLLNSTLLLNFPALMDFKHSTTSVQITAWDVLTGFVSGTTIEFACASLIDGLADSYEVNATAKSAVSFDWKLVILSYR
jgi:hypothetical protein